VKTRNTWRKRKSLEYLLVAYAEAMALGDRQVKLLQATLLTVQIHLLSVLAIFSGYCRGRGWRRVRL
jgi:hypothetical protein